jgi:trehalose 6-phosphate phosphatase
MWQKALINGISLDRRANNTMQIDTKLGHRWANLLPPDTVDLSRTAILLDVDGTLLEIAERPEAVVVPPPLCETLQELLRRSGGAVALVSGRTIETLDRLFQPLLMPAVGQHGAEMRLSPHGPLIRSAASLSPALRAKIQRLAKVDHHILVEEKSNSLAVHYRRAPQQEAFLKREVPLIVAAVAEPGGVEIMFGKAVIDIKPKLFNKGSAVREVMSSAPFARRRLVFVGDDTTDESVFAILPELNGIGYSVGRTVDGTQGTFSSPAHVRSWLAQIAASARA